MSVARALKVYAREHTLSVAILAQPWLELAQDGSEVYESAVSLSMANASLGDGQVNMSRLLGVLQLQDPAEDKARKRAQTTNARMAKVRRRCQKKVDTLEGQKQDMANALSIVTTLNVECRSLLGVKKTVSDRVMSSFAKMWAFQRLAMGRRRHDDFGVLHQTCAQELVCKSALEIQRSFWSKMIASSARDRTARAEAHRASSHQRRSSDFAFLGCRLMWDEAAHKLRPLLSYGEREGNASAPSSGHTVLQVMSVVCVLTCVCVGVSEGGDWFSAQRWEPWLCPLRILASTHTNYILQALLSSLPFLVDDGAARDTVLRACDLFVFVLACDAASSNIKSIKYLLHVLRQEPRFLMHPEICSVHQLHIVKTRAFDLVNVAGILYSLSKIMRVSTTLQTFHSTLHAVVSNCAKVSLRKEGGSGDDDSDFTKVVKSLFAVNGCDAHLHKTLAGGVKVPTRFWENVLALCLSCSVTPSGKLTLYVDDSPASRLLSATDLRKAAVDSFMEPMSYLFVHRAWKAAALSRWTHISEALKKVVLGCLLGRIVPLALATISTSLRVDERAVEDAMAKFSELEKKGGASEGASAWAKHGKRVMRISKFFAQEGQSWQLGCLTVTTCMLDHFHHAIIGHGGGTRANLSTMVDPRKTIIGSTLQMCLEHLKSWTFEAGSPWCLLKWLSAPSLSHAPLQDFARRLLVQVSCGVFRRFEVRFSSLCYKVQWLISDGATDADRDHLANLLWDADEHCLPDHLKKLRKWCGSKDALLGPKVELRCCYTWKRMAIKRGS